ncbi:hypothetical protein [Labilibacter marinus]|uniref:hypothetical protein n=1 Tax=Labilibacter marinus TaxID=1477105 RepID=UPI00094F5181|nr:hypothetical protein [Labilibacter marinus]
MKIKLLLIAILSLTINWQTHAQEAGVAELIPNYNNWKWDNVYVLKNKYISVATVPDAGGRILEHNLGDYKSLWANPDYFGKSFPDNDEVTAAEWRNFGGYRIVPVPRTNWAIDKEGKKTKRWPPPVTWGDAPYQARIIKKDGVQYVETSSGVQSLPIPSYHAKSKSFIKPNKIEEEFQYKRSIHIQEGSSLLVLKHTVINRGDSIIKRGFMTSSQHISRSKPELTDGENYRAYIPFSPELKMPDGEQFHLSANPEQRWRFVNRQRMPLDKNNPEHVKRFYNSGTNYLGETAPGVFEMHYDYYLMAGLDMIASESWVCYVDKINNTAFAKILEPFNPALDYPDGTNLSVFNSGVAVGYLETEVRSPIYTLKPEESFDYIEMIGSAKINNTPILSVNKTGIITERLHFKEGSLKGQYGVFVEGKAILQLKDVKGKLLKEISLEEVNPLKAFALNISLKKVKGLGKIVLLIESGKSDRFVLDSLKL